MTELNYIILLPIAAGIILFAFPRGTRILKGILALMTGLVALVFAVRLFGLENGIHTADLVPAGMAAGSLFNRMMQGISGFCTFNIDPLSRFITLCTTVFTVLITVYSLACMKGEREIRHFYPYVLLTLGLTTGAVLTDNLLFFITFWGILGITLYKLIPGHDEAGSAAAKKTLIMIGASDGIMLLGIGIIWRIYGTLSMSALDIPTTYPVLVAAFLTLVTGSFTKAGAFPFHTWIPDYTQKAPAASSALLPASLDKLLGIYFLARLCVDMFILEGWLVFVLLLVGVMTIIFAVMMALIQHEYKKLLGYHAVSQVGYMVVGLALGTPLGIAGGLFHMINNAIYKSGLFLVAGNVEKATGKNDLDNLGGLSKAMPLTFVAALIFALSISGVPPLNGFASKWLIYQGIIDFGTQPGAANQIWYIWLGLAVLGSALTLASFIKFVAGIFLGRKSKTLDKVREVSPLMWGPGILLALVCLVFGIFAASWVVPRIIMPLYGSFEYTGIWQSTTVSILILASIVLGVLIYWLAGGHRFRTDEIFIGGETTRDQTDFPVTGFYKTIQSFRFFSVIYKQAEKKWFDIYDVTAKIVFSLGNLLSKAHTGVLTAYAIWIFAGLVLFMLILFQFIIL